MDRTDTQSRRACDYVVVRLSMSAHITKRSSSTAYMSMLTERRGTWAPQRAVCAVRLLVWEVCVVCVLTVVVEQLLDEVDVCQQHATTAVAPQPQRIQRVHLTVVRRQKIDVLLPTLNDNRRGGSGQGRSQQAVQNEVSGTLN